VISGNTFLNQTTYAINMIRTGSYTSIVGNTMSGTGNRSIMLLSDIATIDGVSIVGNKIQNTDDYCISAISATNTHITGNDFKSPVSKSVETGTTYMGINLDPGGSMRVGPVSGVGAVELQNLATGGLCLVRDSAGAASVEIDGRSGTLRLLVNPGGAPLPSVGEAKIFTDVSGGKQRVMAQFPTGVAQQIAIEP